MGSLKLKVEPFPSSEFTQMVPPMAVTRPLQIESPNPVPGSNSFNCKNRSKMCPSLSFGMPLPVSDT